MLRWIFKRFEELTPAELYDALALRQKVFIVEQKCAYQDADGKDKNAHHLLGYRDEKLVVYARITFPGVMFKEVAIGRIVSDTEERGKGYGKIAVEKGLDKIKDIYGNVPVRIAAQSHLVKFYEAFGFAPVDDEYVWDGIKHQDMLKSR